MSVPIKIKRRMAARLSELRAWSDVIGGDCPYVWYRELAATDDLWAAERRAVAREARQAEEARRQREWDLMCDEMFRQRQYEHTD